MNEPKLICPRCQKEVTLVLDGRFPICPECGTRFQYRIQGSADNTSKPGWRDEISDVVHALIKVVLIMAAIVVVGVAVLFAGCAVLLSTGMH
jgi:transposase-like protein